MKPKPGMGGGRMRRNGAAGVPSPPPPRPGSVIDLTELNSDSDEDDGGVVEVWSRKPGDEVICID